MPAKPPENSDPGQGAGKKSGKERPCPICGKPAAAASKPFCSERCRDVDLNRWLSGSYVIPAAKDNDEDAE
jgi:endogenous inhibitor of DNA gyrase (YacG/DUF329 family)